MLLEPHLSPRPANFQALTPVDFLARALDAYPARDAVAWRGRTWSYGAFAGMVAALGERLRSAGVLPGDVVSVLCANRPEMLAAHFAVPMIGAVLNAINTRLDADTVAYILHHSGSRLLLHDAASADLARPAAAGAGIPALRFAETAGEAGADIDVLARPPVDRLDPPLVTDEWQPICINYTSGTTGRPKGVVYHHRGAYLNALGNVLALGLDRRTRYLWTLPMFHCNGWCHAWAVTAAGGLHVCIERVDPALIFPAIAEHGVTHMGCAPVVLYMLLNHPAREGRDTGRRVLVATGGAAPTASLIAALDGLGFDLIHLYGLTESYGPATLRVLDDAEAVAPAAERAQALARQGVRHMTAGRVRVLDDAGRDVPADGRTLGEIALAGNTIMAGYYRDAEASETAFRGGVFHTGDLAVLHPDGNIEIKDRSKDIIISGGENISSLEVESVLHQHPAVLIAAVVAAPDGKWGEVPCAFLELKAGAAVSAEELRAFCRERLAGFKVPRRFVFRELPKTATGKIQKFALRERAREEAG
jgi:fatty-acyl-CoA synthase